MPISNVTTFKSVEIRPLRLIIAVLYFCASFSFSESLESASTVSSTKKATQSDVPTSVSVPQEKAKTVVADKVNMVKVAAGCFEMGAGNMLTNSIGFVTSAAPGRPDEQPKHEVCLTSFYMDKYEVTQDQFWAEAGICPWVQCTGEFCSRVAEKMPAFYVNWKEAKDYCEKVGKRLPTEAEFEFSLRAGSNTKYAWGDKEEDACAQANVADKSARAKWTNWTISPCQDGNAMLAPVGSYAPNAWGLYDLAGNAWEWTNDWYDPGYYTVSGHKDPRGPTSGPGKVYRGGAWDSKPEYLPASYRKSAPLTTRDAKIGFRCVVTVR